MDYREIVTHLIDAVARIETKVDNVIDTMDKAGSDDGYTRCVRHEARMETVELWQKETDKNITWWKRVIVGTTLTAAIGALIKHFIFPAVAVAAMVALI